MSRIFVSKCVFLIAFILSAGLFQAASSRDGTVSSTRWTLELQWPPDAEPGAFAVIVMDGAMLTEAKSPTDGIVHHTLTDLLILYPTKTVELTSAGKGSAWVHPASSRSLSGLATKAEKLGADTLYSIHKTQLPNPSQMADVISVQLLPTRVVSLQIDSDSAESDGMKLWVSIATSGAILRDQFTIGAKAKDVVLPRGNATFRIMNPKYKPGDLQMELPDQVQVLETEPYQVNLELLLTESGLKRINTEDGDSSETPIPLKFHLTSKGVDDLPSGVLRIRPRGSELGGHDERLIPFSAVRSGEFVPGVSLHPGVYEWEYLPQQLSLMGDSPEMRRIHHYISSTGWFNHSSHEMAHELSLDITVIRLSGRALPLLTKVIFEQGGEARELPVYPMSNPAILIAVPDFTEGTIRFVYRNAIDRSTVTTEFSFAHHEPLTEIELLITKQDTP